MGYTYGIWQLGAGADFEVGTAWKQQWIGTFAGGMAAANITDHFILSRSAWIGTNKFGNTLWSGDQQSTWGAFAKQVQAGQGAGLSGQGYWTTDAGGYVNGNPADPSFQELFVRWIQFAAFSPVTRLHGHRDGGPGPDECGGTNGDNELWNLCPQPDQYAAAVTALRLRESLRNYVAQLSAEHAATGMPLMRPLFLQFPSDAGCVTGVEDQFMLGPDW